MKTLIKIIVRNMKVFKKNYLIILFQKFIKKIKMILYQILDYNSENLNNEDDSFSDDDKLYIIKHPLNVLCK